MHNNIVCTDDLEEAEFSDLLLELKGVIKWFELGVHLKVPVDNLLTINANCKSVVETCRLQMLLSWRDLEKPTWSKLVAALIKIRSKSLAKKLSEKYGEFMILSVSITNSLYMHN